MSDDWDGFWIPRMPDPEKSPSKIPEIRDGKVDQSEVYWNVFCGFLCGIIVGIAIGIVAGAIGASYGLAI